MRSKDQVCRLCGGRRVVPSKKLKGRKVPCPKCGGSGRGYATK